MATAAWVAKAREETYPELELPPPLPPLEIHDDFENTPVGSPPAGAVAHVEHHGDSIAVTAETAAGGKHSVKIVDAPGLSHAYDPHLTYENLSQESGRVRNTFDLRIAADSRINVEWRDYHDGAYQTGPHFAIYDGRLSLGKESLALPPDVWIHFEITCGLGPAAAEGWTFRVGVPGQPPREFHKLPLASGDFKRLTWLGFTSNATYKTTFYLDNLELAPLK